MKLLELRKELLIEYKASLNVRSKFYDDDVRAFSEGIATIKDESKLRQQLSNLRALKGKDKAFNAEVSKIEAELDKGGMYNVDKLGGRNALD